MSPCRRPIVPDDPELLTTALAEAAAEADLVLLVAGSAKGRGDHAVTVIASAGEVVVQGVAIRPGHPVVLGLTGSTPVIGVPGYPVSAALAFELFGVRLLAALGDRQLAPRPRVQAVAAPRDPVDERQRGVGSGARRAGRRRPRRDPAATRRRRAQLARPRGRSRPRRARSRAESTPASRSTSSCSARSTGSRRTLLVTGSTDPLLEELAPHLCRDSPRGAGRGCRWTRTGRRTAPLPSPPAAAISRSSRRGDIPAGAITLARWERTVGLMLAPGNPLEIDGIEALARPGSGSPTGSPDPRPEGSSTSG